MANLSKEVSIIIFSSAFLLLVAVGIITLVLVYQRKQTQYIQEKNILKAAFEKELLEAQLQMQEQTLKHIAQEIHDNIGQSLSLAKLHLNTIRPEQQEHLWEKMTHTKELVSKAIADLRALSKTLHTEAVLSAGLVDAIETELKRIEKTAVFQTNLSVTGTPTALDPQKELILFRTVQEALNNAIKHSEASRIDVEVVYEQQSLQVIIRDNGIGFDRQAAEKSPDRGSGLRNMHNRARLIGGSLSVDGQSSGTKVHVNLPIIVA